VDAIKEPTPFPLKPSEEPSEEPSVEQGSGDEPQAVRTRKKKIKEDTRELRARERSND